MNDNVDPETVKEFHQAEQVWLALSKAVPYSLQIEVIVHLIRGIRSGQEPDVAVVHALREWDIA